MSCVIRCCCWTLCAGLLMWTAKATAAEEAIETTPSTQATPASAVATPLQASHKQVRSIRPRHNGEPIHLNTYCLGPTGDILACVGGANVSYQPDANGGYKIVQSASESFVQVYSSEGELKAEWAVPFKPTAINVASDQTIFVAGEGQVARLSTTGEILTTAAVPQQGDPEELKKLAIAKFREQQADFIARLEKQIAFADEQAAKILETPEAERTKSQEARLKAYARQKELYDAQLQAIRQQKVDIEAAAGGGKPNVVTALAVSDQHLFICYRNPAGSGYEVVRCGFDFQNPLPVLTGLSGCCGQMDIQARGDRLVVAANTKFQVALHDVEGRSVGAFGGRDRAGGAGFGSCCNPMNVRCCPNGEILTAESSIGDIKRFSTDGKLLAYIGRAKISGGCKHVAIDWDPKLDRYYMMNVSDSTICVLVPRSEAPEFTEEEQLAKEAREGLGRKVVGQWKLPGAKAKVAANSPLASVIQSLLGSGSSSSARRNVLFETVDFAADGKLKITGGQYGEWGVDSWQWAAVRQDPAQQTVDIDMLMDGIQYVTLRVQVTGDGSLKISQLSGERTNMTADYERFAATPPSEVETDRPIPAATAAEPAPAAGP